MMALRTPSSWLRLARIRGSVPAVLACRQRHLYHHNLMTPLTDSLSLPPCRLMRPVVSVRYSSNGCELSELEYDTIAEETLESLSEVFDNLSESIELGPDYDVNYSQGVLTVKFGGSRGTYVINKQTPNKQIWLSSPTSGPKRYDFIKGTWMYSREKRTLHQLLNDEISAMLSMKFDFTECSYGGKS